VSAEWETVLVGNYKLLMRHWYDGLIKVIDGLFILQIVQHKAADVNSLLYVYRPFG